MSVSVIGCGRWGTFLGWYANKIGHEVLIWGRESSCNMAKLIETRKNEYLQLNDDVVLTTSLEAAINFSDFIIISISSQQLRTMCQRLNELDLNGKTIILAMKGIEVDTGFRLSQVLLSEIKQHINVSIWVGPGHTQAFTEGIPNCMLISSTNIDISKKIVDEFSSELIRLYIGQDIIGNEIGAAAKNVIGIAAGMLDGLNFSSLKGALMARGSREVARLVRAMGGNELTVYGLSHIGDYEATLFSEFSHNRKFGEDFVKGVEFNKLAEGVSTVKALLLLAKKCYVDMPICNAIYSILYNNEDPKQVLNDLFLRPITFEF
ncbi:MAG: glycerol-3-phosphate dehydrogenase [Firmicutes bacterium HGW-Firmicutes-7]|nr:MAG: glycerol-3-phosphate dehydrogenase [Firmicutes bacterium HGW-Firmicutes-7]